MTSLIRTHRYTRMNNEIILNELNAIRKDREESERRLKAMQESMRDALINGVGDEIRENLIRSENPSPKDRIRLFLKRILNTI